MTADQAIRQSVIGQAIRVRGIVQGVGFRPFVWQLAHELGLVGEVQNDADGVLILAWGSADRLERLQQRLIDEAPPLAQIHTIEQTAIESAAPEAFTIRTSGTGEALTDISADAATCPACLAEIRDPDNRRYRYPFSNCTHCGPRLSILRQIPYDRAHTSMASFALCPRCQAEYDDPADRRFHAQPNACPECGPQLWLENNRGEILTPEPGRDVIAEAAERLRSGEILAIKGIGGFHLACDATNDAAVKRLRERKRRNAKPFALMARELETIRHYVEVDEAEAKLLASSAAPIVLLRRRSESSFGVPDISVTVAPEQGQLGFMLPYTPLHHLLLDEVEVPLVMSSANLSEEVPCIDNTQAREHLASIVDTFLLHERDIINRLDDSIARVIEGRVQVLRRARGYAPQPLVLPEWFTETPPILAMGAELKNSFCLLKAGRAIVAPYQGDLEQASVQRDYCHNLELYAQLYDHHPSVIAVDAHPDYVSTRLGRERAAALGATLIEVQHHHAHIAAVMAEHGLGPEARVLGLVFDGLGYGEGGELWGGEFLLADYGDYRRLAHLAPVAMIGGAQAMREPWRNAFAHLHQALGWETVARDYSDLAFVRRMQDKPIDNLMTMLEKGLNCPPASSAGRLFDAVAAVMGLHTEAVSFEGQAAMALESLAQASLAEVSAYPYQWREEEGIPVLHWAAMWQALLADLSVGREPAEIAARFHHTLVAASVERVKALSEEHGLRQIVLSGGVMQNRFLLRHLMKALEGLGLEALIPLAYPANDGGIALGQSLVAARVNANSSNFD